MVIWDPCFKQIHVSTQDLENKNGIILELIWNNCDAFRELIQNNTTH